MENVEGLLLGEAWSYVQRIYKNFKEAGYQLKHYLCKCEYMGVPQTRHRVFFIAFRNDIQFDFNLLNETSRESVIEGINNAHIRDLNAITNNATDLSFTAGSIIKGGKVSYQNNRLSLEEEADLGRDFDVKTQLIEEEKMNYDSTMDIFQLE